MTYIGKYFDRSFILSSSENEKYYFRIRSNNFLSDDNCFTKIVGISTIRCCTFLEDAPSLAYCKSDNIFVVFQIWMAFVLLVLWPEEVLVALLKR